MAHVWIFRHGRPRTPTSVFLIPDHCPLALSQVIAVYFHPRRTMEVVAKPRPLMTTVQTLMNTIADLVPRSLFPGPFSLFLLPKQDHPTPPRLCTPFIDPFISCNRHGIKRLYFIPINESVTANCVFCPSFGRIVPIYPQESHIFHAF